MCYQHSSELDLSRGAWRALIRHVLAKSSADVEYLQSVYKARPARSARSARPACPAWWKRYPILRYPNCPSWTAEVITNSGRATGPKNVASVIASARRVSRWITSSSLNTELFIPWALGSYPYWVSGLMRGRGRYVLLSFQVR